jgi:sec-independent protein translocase protein TatA
VFDDGCYLKYNDSRLNGKFKKFAFDTYFGGQPMMPGPWELIVILLIVVMIFGAKRIPEIMGGIGKGIKTFKKSMDDDPEPTPAGNKAQPEPADATKQGKPAA